MHKLLFLIVYLFLVTCDCQNAPAKPTQCTNIYASNDKEIHLDSADGSQEKPFSQMNQALSHVSSLLSQNCVNILLRPSSKPYLLGESEYTISSKQTDFLIISVWEDLNLVEGHFLGRPTLNFDGSFLEILDLELFSLSGIEIIGMHGCIITNDTNVELKDLDINSPFGLIDPFIIINNAKKTYVTNINFGIAEEMNPFLFYHRTKLTNAHEVKIQNILVLVKQTEEKDAFQTNLFELNVEVNALFGSLSVDNFQIRVEENPIDYNFNTFFYVKGFQTVSITNWVFVNSNIMLKIMRPWLNFKANLRIEFNNFNISNNNLVLFIDDSLILIDETTKLTFQNLTFNQNKLDLKKRPSMHPFSIIHFYLLWTLQLENQTITNNEFDGNVALLRFLEGQSTAFRYITQTLAVKNSIIINNSNKDSSNEFAFLKMDASRLQSFTLANMKFSQNQLSGRFLSIKARNIENQISYFELKNVSITENLKAEDTSFLYLAHIEDTLVPTDCIQLFESINLVIDDITIANNKFWKGKNPLWFYEVSLFQIQGPQVSIQNSQIRNNSFQDFNFLHFEQKPSTIIFSSNKVLKNTFLNSQFISSDFRTEYSCIYQGNKPMDLSTPFYKYNLILNSDFSDIQLSSSVLLELGNGNFILKGNFFHNFTLHDSHLIYTNLQYHLKSHRKATFIRNKGLEASLCLSNPVSCQLFIEMLDRTCTDQPESVYISSFIQNNFIDIKSESLQFISLNGFKSEQTFINLENNEIEVFVSKNNNLLSSFLFLDGFTTLRIKNNAFRLLNGRIDIFSFPQIQTSKLLSVTENNVQHCNIESFLSYKGKSVENIDFIQNSFYMDNFGSMCVLLDVENTQGIWSLNDNILKKAILYLDEANNQGEHHGFITLVNSNVSTDSKLLFNNNTVIDQHLKVNKQETPLRKLSFLFAKVKQPIQVKDNYLQDITMLDPGSLLELLSPAPLVIFNSTFISIHSNSTKGMINLNSKETLIQNSTFKYVGSQNGLGLFSLTPFLLSYTLQILDSNFTNINFKFQGQIFTMKSSDSTGNNAYDITLLIDNTIISNLFYNLAISLSGVNCFDCKISNSFFQSTRNNVSPTGTIQLTEKVSGKLTLQDLTVPQLPFHEPLIQILDSNIEVTLEGMKYSGGNQPFNLAHLDSGSLIVKDSIFENINGNRDPFITIIPSTKHKTPKSSELSANIYLENSRFINFINNGPTIFKFKHLKDPLQYEYFPGEDWIGIPLIFSVIPTSLIIKDCLFENFINMSTVILGANSDPLYSKSSTSLLIKGSTFRKNEFSLGGSISVMPKCYSPSVTIEDSLFEDNIGYLGGAMMIYNSSLKISSSRFDNNEATSIGAAIFEGGTTIKNKVLDDKVIFRNNKAFYPGDIRSEAVDFMLKFIGSKNTKIQSGIEVTEDGPQLVLNNVSVLDFQKGKLLLEYIDANGNPAPDYSEFKAGTLDVYTNTEGKGNNLLNAQIEIIDKLSSVIHLSNIIFTDKENETIFFSLTYTSDRINTKKVIPLKIRPCMKGEFFHNELCQPCVFPTYSLSPSQPCTQCPSNGICLQPDEICPRGGFWNHEKNPEAIHGCRDDHIMRCENNNGCRSCASGYSGPLCEACDFDNDYVENGYLKCGKCQDPNKSLVYSIVISVVYFLYQLFCIKAIYDTNTISAAEGSNYLRKRKIERSFYIKSLLTYTQLISFLYRDASQVFKSLGLMVEVGNPSSLIVYGTQCSLKALEIKPYDFIFYQISLVLGYPLFQTFLILILLITLKACKTISLRKAFTTTLIYFIMSYQPGILTTLAQFLSCKTLKGLGYKYIAAHAYWKCDDDSRYSFFANVIAMPSLIVWGVAIPIVLLILLCYNNKTQGSKNSLALLHVLKADLEDKYYYWGIVLMMLKVIISFLIFGLESHSEVQICLSLVLLWTYQSFVKIFKPYHQISFNNFEIIMMNLLMFNIVIAKYLIDPANGVFISGIFVAISALLNGGFLILVIWKIVSLTFLDVVANVEKHIMGREVSRNSELRESFNMTL